MRILIIEDEADVEAALREGLEAESYDVVVEPTGDDGCRRLLDGAFDVVLLDLELSGRSGMDILAGIRRHRIMVPVLALTARDTVQDRVAGLDAGADDCLVKPFALPELLARVRALCRRGAAREAVQLAIGPLRLDRRTRRVTRSGVVLDLTVKEFELLEYLMRHEGQVVSRESLAREVWREAGRTPSLDNVLEVLVGRLRRKVERDEPDRLIHTIRGVGYMLRR